MFATDVKNGDSFTASGMLIFSATERTMCSSRVSMASACSWGSAATK
jgi:hypothetical protein